MSIHDRLAQQLNKCPEKTSIPEWMSKPYPDPERPLQRNHPQKLFTDNVSANKVENSNCPDKRGIIYYSLVCYGQFPEEQKGCHRGTRGIDDLLYIDQHIIKEAKTKQKNIARSWIDDKKAYKIVLHT